MNFHGVTEKVLSHSQMNVEEAMV